MDTTNAIILALLGINILMGSAKFNDFNVFYNHQMDELSTIDEGLKDYLRNGLAAAMLAFSPFSSFGGNQTDDTNNKSPAIEQKTYKMIGGYTAEQARNIIARTLFDEARGEGTSGIDAVASVIYNRSGGNIEKLPKVCLQKYQFSQWNGQTNLDPKNYKIKTPSGTEKDKTMWRYCNKIAGKLIFNEFSSTIGNLNSYYAHNKVTPDWADSLQNTKKVGNHTFGYLPEWDGTKPHKTQQQKFKKHIVKRNDTLGTIAKLYNVTVDDILKINSKYRNNPNRIQIGDKVLIPNKG